jgi:hypothetical protein
MINTNIKMTFKIVNRIQGKTQFKKVIGKPMRGTIDIITTYMLYSKKENGMPCGIIAQIKE